MNRTNRNPTVISCRCGEVEFQLTGKPILTTICHCDDCQRASRELELLPKAPRILDLACGTPYVLYRKDRVACIKGLSLLKDHRMELEPFTKRIIAVCCNSPMYLDFEKGHWLSLFRDRFGGQAPGVQMRTQTRFIPKPATIPLDVPRYSAFSFGFISKLIVSMVAMKISILPKKRNQKNGQNSAST